MFYVELQGFVGKKDQLQFTLMGKLRTVDPLVSLPEHYH